jgi:hypothetical protein
MILFLSLIYFIQPKLTSSSYDPDLAPGWAL